MKLVIVESPNKCSKIKSFLGAEYSVTASVGHIREIPKKGLNIDISHGFEPCFEVSKDKKDVVKSIKEAAKKASIIYLATDMDREGESISQHLYDIMDKECQKKCKRITFVEITKKAILDAIANPREIDKNLVDAQKARQVLDRLIGYKISPTLWYTAKINNSSAGRVQSVAVKIIYERQKEIDAFKSEDYWFIEALLKCKNGEFLAKVVTKDKDNKYLNDKVATADLEKLKTASYVIDKIERAEKKNNPYPPFDTSSLQSTCSSVFGWSLTKSQAVAQKLYEAGKVSYIRSDSFNIAQEALDEVRKLIKEGYSEEYLPKQANVYTKKSAAASQEAHECIRPTHSNDNGDDIADETEKKMYKLIRDRFIACQMSPQVVDGVIYNIKASTDHNLIARGQTIKFDGWSKVYKYSKTKEEVLPSASEKEKLELKDINKTKHSTQPPNRYNEGTLAKEMEKNGVGRPSTRANIINSIIKKEYVEKDKKSKGLIVTPLGIKIYNFLQPNFQDFIMDIKYTATLEEELDKIAEGQKTYCDTVGSVYENLQKHIKASENNSETKPKEATKMGTKCTVCKEGDIVEREGKFGKFYSCNAYPKCKTIYTQDEDGNFTIKEKKVFQTSGKKCPECEKNDRKGELIERKNRSNGNSFYGCSCWPKCKYSAPVEGGESKPKSSKKGSEESEENDTNNTQEDDDLNLDIG